ncbi:MULTISPECIES: hypothetical protein [Achromobacter]|uniref:Uncharacterized protein n=1 Tax=Achromobacter denitrificans TaxID=32002 RepID=A0ABZ3G096_ACHDE|nr:hypothetical protein [Achromobacter xylosoxidans]QCS62725.1 hypothetical protein EC609_09400 [Achromobacter denitrificans]
MQDQSIPTLSELQALDGRIFATLTAQEALVMDFYRRQGRKFDVVIGIINEADTVEVAAARTEAEADELMKQANSRISVTIGPRAESAWTQRVGLRREC